VQLTAVDLEKYLAETFTRRITKGFWLLGYYYRRKGLAVAERPTSNLCGW
jgi:hypothetical protein